MNEKRNGEMCQCVHLEMRAHWGTGEQSFLVERHHFSSRASTQGRMGVECPGLVQWGKGPAEAGRRRVNRLRGGNERKGDNSPSVLMEYP